MSVVTPFFNTADYLDECIRSVRAQSYDHFEYILVDNCSTDGSREIAERHAAEDGRVRFYRTERFLSQVDNYNQAIARISASAEFCTITQADDAIHPDFVSEMVKVGTSNPAVGVIASYFLEGNRVKGGPVARTVTVLNGRDVCRSSLQGRLHVFGPPTTVMYRAAIVRSRDPFFNPSLLHEDTDVLFQILKEWDLGFVHQILSYVRIGNPSITSRVIQFSPYALDRFLRAMMYADTFFEGAVAHELKKSAESRYLSFLAAEALSAPGAQFWRYHKAGWKSIEYELRWAKFAAYVAKEILDLLGNPKRTIQQALNRIGSFKRSDEMRAKAE